MLDQGEPQSAVARLLNVDQSTISRLASRSRAHGGKQMTASQDNLSVTALGALPAAALQDILCIRPGSASHRDSTRRFSARRALPESDETALYFYHDSWR
jgi:hypothetical protein